MYNLIRPFLVLLAIAVATVASLRHDAPTPPTLATPIVKVPRASAASAPQSGHVRRVRRLLFTRLDHPADLRIEGVRPSRKAEYAGVMCGRVAWSDDGYKRFIAAKRNVLIDGRTPDFDRAWQRICNGSPTMGIPPQIHATP